MKNIYLTFILVALMVSGIGAGDDDAVPIGPPKKLSWGDDYTDVVTTLKEYKLDVKKLKKPDKYQRREMPKDYRVAEVKGKHHVGERKVWKTHLVFNSDKELVAFYNQLRWSNEEGEGGFLIKGNGHGRKQAWNFVLDIQRKLNQKYGQPEQGIDNASRNTKLPSQLAYWVDNEKNSIMLEILANTSGTYYYVAITYKSSDLAEDLKQRAKATDEI